MRRPVLLTLSCTILIGLGACTQFPALDETQTAALERADYPALVPIEPILAGVDSTPPSSAEEEAVLEARLTALRARAQRMRGSVLTGAEKQRLEQGLQ